MGNMAQLMKQAQKAMEQARTMEAELANSRVDGTAGGGMVRATVNGAGSIEAVTIDPSCIDPNDVEMLQDLVVLAIRDAQEHAQKIRQDRLGSLTNGLPIPPGLF